MSDQPITTTMIDDTRGIASASNGETNTHSRPCLATNVKEILKSGVPRVQTARWANSLRFLTFDDGDDSKASMGASPITEHESSQPIALMGQCRPCEERLPLPSGHACSIKSTWSFAQGIKDREAELAKYDNPCMHVLERSCEKCHSIPLFPNHEPVTRFRVRRLNILDGENNNCVHFVAVSYCWSSDDRTQLGEPYKVTDEDGNVRGARAPNATIDRAVAFARENGFRMIWIDQVSFGGRSPLLNLLVYCPLTSVRNARSVSIRPILSRRRLLFKPWTTYTCERRLPSGCFTHSWSRDI